MATLTYFDIGLAVNPSLDQVLDPNGAISKLTATVFEITTSPGPWSGYRFQLTGTDFTYAGNQPFSGRISSLSIISSDGQIVAKTDTLGGSLDLGNFWSLLRQVGTGESQALSYLMQQIGWQTGSDGADHLVAISGGVAAGGGNDHIELSGTSGNADAGAGDDLIVLRQTSGALSVFGGEGVDTLDVRYDASTTSTITASSGIEAISFSGFPNASLAFFWNPDLAALNISNLTDGLATIRIRGVNETDIDLSRWTFGNLGGGIGVRIDGSNSELLVGTNRSDAIFGGNVENVYAGDGNDRISVGYAGTIYGGSGDDFFQSGGGSHTLNGDIGNDTFLHYFSTGAAGGQTHINGGTGSDTVQLSGGVPNQSYNLTVILNGSQAVEVGGIQTVLRNVENVTTHNGRDRLVGDQFDNHLNSSGGDDVLQGGGGKDTLDGGSGNDFADFSDKMLEVVVTLGGAAASNVLVGGIIEDTVLNIENLIGGAGHDTLTGDGLQNALTGGGGNDVVNGNGGADTLDGLAGDDKLGGGAGKDKIDGGDGIDTAYYRDKTTSVILNLNGAVDATVFVGGLVEDTLRNIENVTGGTGNDALTGDGKNNVLDGSDGNDTLNGGASADSLIGGRGNDTYFVDNVADRVIEANGAGTDTVITYVGFSAVSQFVENITLRGTGSFAATGNNLANTLTGNAGNNRLDGRGGADVMIGGAGNDTYYVDNAGDRVVEANGGGTDLVYSSVSLVFTSTFAENITLTGSSNLNSTGNSLSNVIRGNAGNNALNGREGNDTLVGGAGNDSFVFNTALNAAANVDRITDFNAANDTIMVDNAVFTSLALGALPVGGFRANMTGTAQDANDRIIYETDTGRLLYDHNGSAAGGGVVFARLNAGLSLTASDFLVI